MSAVVLAVTAPLSLVIAASIKIHDSGPVLFRQRRAGTDGAPFEMLKFRTMIASEGDDDGLNTTGWVDGVPDDFVFKTPQSGIDRVTPVGRWLRRFSLDELPQFVNVLAGQMTLVGPRPEILPIAERYSPAQARRLAVKPGITGWAQVTGRSTHDHGQKIEADLYYVDHRSMRLDLRILVRTVAVALRGRDAY